MTLVAIGVFVSPSIQSPVNNVLRLKLKLIQMLELYDHELNERAIC
jgi:hypothetical protein